MSTRLIPAEVRARRPLSLVALALAAGYACSAVNDDRGHPLSSAGAGSGGVGGTGPASGSGGDFTIDAGRQGICGSDLQTIVHADGGVEICPPDQGCVDGACVPACDAAAASKGTVGCDFVVATPDFFSDPKTPGATSPCFAVFIANNWSKDVHIQVSRGGVTLDPTLYGRVASGSSDPTTWPALPAGGLSPKEVAVLFMSRDPSTTYKCPVGAVAVDGSTAVSGTGRGQAFHITTDLPVSAYDMLPFGGASSFLPSAELLLPTTAWGTNYVVAVPRIGVPENAYPPGPQWGQVVAYADGTTVQIAPTSPLPGGTDVDPAPTGAVTTYTLNAGEFIQWAPSGEMSGSVISADKPVGVSGGNAILCLMSATSTGGGCDSAHQQIPPVSALGSLYVVTPYASRMSPQPESVPYRMVGSVAGTTLTYDPPVPGAPTTLQVGEVADFESTIAFKVESQDQNHPFYVAQMMTGCNVTGGDGLSIGDEEYVNVLPPAQFLSKYVFFTDPTYKTTSLVITRQKTATGFKDVKVDCLGNIMHWQPVGSSGDYEYATAYLLDNGKPQNGCTNGPHQAESDGPFGLVVWGLAKYASYAYPAGGNVASINDVQVQPVPW